MGSYVSVRVRDGKFNAYLASPKSGSGPGVLVIQEIFGVNKVMRDICDGYAEQGFFAMCPDIFWRQEPGVDITDQSQAEWDKAFSLYKGFDVGLGIDDLIVSLTNLRATTGCTGKVGVTGYCLGGYLTYLMACRSTADAAVGYYGVGIEGNLDEARAIKRPLMLHIAEKDGFVPPEAQAKVKAALAVNPLVTLHTYPEDDHAFAREGGQHYNPASASAANTRTLEFFRKHLG